MIIDEALLTFAEAALLLPRNTSPSTLWRWYRKGILGIRLEALRLGGRHFTSQEALERFVSALSSLDSIPEHSQPASTHPNPMACGVSVNTTDTILDFVNKNTTTVRTGEV